VTQLERQNLTIVKIVEKHGGGGSVKLSELARFLFDMSILMDASILLPEALELFSKGESKSALRRELKSILREIREGKSLSDSMRQRPGMFPSICTALVRAGETSGRMGIIFSQLSRYFENIDSVRVKVIQSLSYPLFIMGLAVIIVCGLCFFVAPKFAEIYVQIGLPIPGVTKIFLFLGSYSKVVLVFFILLILTVIALPILLRRNKRVRLLFDRLKLRLVLIGPILYQVSISNFCRTLGILYESGIKLPDAVALAAGAAGNSYLTERMKSLREGIQEGCSLADVVEREGLFGDENIGMLRVGERSGNLATILHKIADILVLNAESTIRQALTLLEPALISFIAVFVGGIVVSLALPILNLQALLQQ
jgi:type II secretory pathway component PulF